MGILSIIVAKKKERLRDARSLVPLKELKKKIAEAQSARDFRAAVKCLPDENIKLIAEIKKASPSKGILREKFDFKAIAQCYEKKQVNAISVITETDFFMGNLAFIPEVKQITSKPILRKDFIVDIYQIYESRAYGADAILLIAAILEKNQADEYLHLARELGMSVLFEVHNYKEMETALLLECDIIGINNRDLETMKVDLETTITLRREIPADKIVVSESGIQSRSDLQRLQEIKVDAVLVGTSLMEAEDIGRRIDEIIGPL